ncbi:aspartate kinase [Pallidibacillus thermolactis]|uniref:aspartate kinase n=1 Tax=Pallidibacillus thermolactis TaxID=251051 RepID=UPI002E1D0C19|nr:aspartate kinase [Pallidibacillus thermolactis]MED1673175.1 aspartate kinase [Pallidibacillus thermolactis subsp. kokeshiiformis]
MGIIVQKFGGTSVATVEKILNVADRVLDERKRGNNVVVVVSAMGKSTDELISLAKQVSTKPSKRELDMLVTTGEQVTIALLAMALHEKGHDAVSMTGWQAGVETEPIHGSARILNIDTDRINRAIREGKIVIVAGFQGITEDGEITTLGRGGSDTSAVALAAALGADRCDIYTDVTGVYTADPRYIPFARQLSTISYDEMLELANLGAGVLHPRSVEFAKNYQIPLVVRSSTEKVEGTYVLEETIMEENLVVRGVAFEKDITKLTVYGLSNEIASLSSVFTPLAKNNVNVDIIIQNASDQNLNTLSFSIKTDELQEALQVLEEHKESIGYDHIEYESGLAKVSIVGSGMISNPGVAAQMFASLAEKDIFVKMVSTSEIKVSAVVNEDQMLKAAEILHDVFGLSKVEQEVSVAK